MFWCVCLCVWWWGGGVLDHLADEEVPRCCREWNQVNRDAWRVGFTVFSLKPLDSEAFTIIILPVILLRV